MRIAASNTNEERQQDASQLVLTPMNKPAPEEEAAVPTEEDQPPKLVSKLVIRDRVRTSQNSPFSIIRKVGQIAHEGYEQFKKSMTNKNSYRDDS